MSLGVFQLVFDAVYTPRKTTLLKEAEAAGAIIVSGVEMFLRQAISQFNLFTGGQEGTSLQFFLRCILLLSPGCSEKKTGEYFDMAKSPRRQDIVGSSYNRKSNFCGAKNLSVM